MKQNKKKRNFNQKKDEKINNIEICSDENFAFIAGYTVGGAPFGISHEEMAEIEKGNKQKYNIDLETRE